MSTEIEIVPTANNINMERYSDTSDKYHDFECCEWTRGIDNLLLRYKEDKIRIAHLIENNPDELINSIWKQNSPLAVDNECRCKMGNGEIRTLFACAQCKNMRRLIDFRSGVVDQPFSIQCGTSTGKKLIISSVEIASSYLSWDDAASVRAKLYLEQYANLTICGTPNITNLRCITGDSFTIKTLITWMISRIFCEKGLPHISTLYTSFICNKVGYYLSDIPSIGSLSELHKIEKYHDLSSNINIKSHHFAYTPLKSDIARTIILQLLVILLELSKINFSHGTPSAHSLIFNKEPISYNYDGVHVSGPITIQINNLWNSSATFNKIHFFTKNIKSSVYIEKNLFVPEITVKNVAMAHCYDVDLSGSCTNTLCPDTNTINTCSSKDVALYRLTNSTIDIYTALRHIGFPVYSSTFDFYCFMVSLMCDKSFFDAVNNDLKLYRLWSMMWLVDDLPQVESLVRGVHNKTLPNTQSVAVNIIRGKWLRCDITKFLWSLIKLGW